jgi:hypothetical protein
MREQKDQMRRATTGRVCLIINPTNSARFSVLVPSTVGFDCILLVLSAISLDQTSKRIDPSPKLAVNLGDVGQQDAML